MSRMGQSEHLGHRPSRSAWRRPVAKLYDRIDDRLRAFIAEQPMFFVATAPSAGGHVNVSPKGYTDTFTVLDDHTIAYLELYGSGAETIAHLRENGRITAMFCSFGRSPKILRLYGTGRAISAPITPVCAPSSSLT